MDRGSMDSLLDHGCKYDPWYHTTKLQNTSDTRVRVLRGANLIQAADDNKGSTGSAANKD
jgi:hypothetical protein